MDFRDSRELTETFRNLASSLTFPHTVHVSTIAGRRRAAQAVAARRGELGLTQHQLAAKAGVDPKTVGNLEKRDRWPIAKNRAAIEKALLWPSGEMERIASKDGEPQPDVLAERWGSGDADAVRRVAARHGEAGRVMLREMEREFRPRGEGEQSGPGRASA